MSYLIYMEDILLTGKFLSSLKSLMSFKCYVTALLISLLSMDIFIIFLRRPRRESFCRIGKLTKSVFLNLHVVYQSYMKNISHQLISHIYRESPPVATRYLRKLSSCQHWVAHSLVPWANFMEPGCWYL